MKRLIFYLKSNESEATAVNEAFTELINYVMDDYPMDMCEHDYDEEDYDDLKLKFYVKEGALDTVTEWISSACEDTDFQIAKTETAQVDRKIWEEYCEEEGIEPDQFDD